MRIFRCACGNQIYFENTLCVPCGRALGFLPDALTMSTLEPLGGDRWRALHPGTGGEWRMCRNYVIEQVCNWMVPADSGDAFCVACRLNRVIPDLSKSWNRLAWSRIEVAKRRLVYDLLNHSLPFISKAEDPDSGLAFAFLEDTPETTEFATNGTDGRVFTGHSRGLITINIAEADDVAREQTRVAMNEAYRTLLGHFRHECGHYFWDRLVRDDASWLADFRDVFGDERDDYKPALDRYYDNGPPTDWWLRHISAYASSHPWEDWAETWAHYLQMTDTLETARAVGLAARDERGEIGPTEAPEFTGVSARWDFDSMLMEWQPLTVAINSINRSLGLSDAYPFVLSEGATHKLRFVHKLVDQSANIAV